eukprot:5859726-Prymnesium_polylepis.1
MCVAPAPRLREPPARSGAAAVNPTRAGLCPTLCRARYGWRIARNPKFNFNTAVIAAHTTPLPPHTVAAIRRFHHKVLAVSRGRRRAAER